MSFEIDPEDIGKALDSFRHIKQKEAFQLYDFSVKGKKKFVVIVSLRKFPWFNNSESTAEQYRYRSENMLKEIGVRIIDSYIS